ncbi:hypothetical protein AMECASPLE_006772 [Ameca splendens]|uniref:Uncharacterized protein n=1 Tax=Ameca splendens TaxID=208324 RepID=A0ABV0ZKF4_9TELE
MGKTGVHGIQVWHCVVDIHKSGNNYKKKLLINIFILNCGKQGLTNSHVYLTTRWGQEDGKGGEKTSGSNWSKSGILGSPSLHDNLWTPSTSQLGGWKSCQENSIFERVHQT